MQQYSARGAGGWLSAVLTSDDAVFGEFRTLCRGEIASLISLSACLSGDTFSGLSRFFLGDKTSESGCERESST